MADQLEALVTEQMLDVAARAAEEIVDADDVGALASSRSHRCEPRKPGAAGDQNPLFEMHGDVRPPLDARRSRLGLRQA